ncbi:hypothetical protein NEMIN01_1523 [Nematocida minor]|uniref:uncharacterized protein n=1 Tax=Nematocida minor TaxID=1912983 RepID=UPI00221EC1B2|nr:uncharacterized protein NEMIN01_1523 [Nematocida minor]KAI5191447.1 hypothetical protein NEMIN01_1523 [Nematocida minor]
MKYFRVPVVYAVSDLVLDRLTGSKEAERILESALTRHFTDRKYAHGDLSEEVDRIIEGELLKELSPADRKDKKENSDGNFRESTPQRSSAVADCAGLLPTDDCSSNGLSRTSSALSNISVPSNDCSLADAIGSLEIGVERKRKKMHLVRESVLDGMLDRLWMKVVEYSIDGISPVPLSIGVEGEHCDIALPSFFSQESVQAQCRKVIDKTVRSKVETGFSFSSLWSLGKAIISDKKVLIERAFYLGLSNNPEKMFDVVSEIIGSDDKHPILSEMMIRRIVETGGEIDSEYYVLDSSVPFISSLRYALILYRNIKHLSQEGRSKALFTLARQCMQIECVDEPGVRVLLNIMAINLLEEIEEVDSTQIMLLMDAAGIFVDKNCAHSSESELFRGYARCGLHLYYLAEKLTDTPTVREELCRRIVEVSTILKEPTDAVDELAKGSNWTKHLIAIQRYLRAMDDPEIVIAAGDEGAVWVDRSIKTPPSITMKSNCKNGSDVSAEKLELQLDAARIKYMDRTVEEKDTVYSGERVVLTVNIPGEIQCIKSVLLEIDGKLVKINKNGKVRMSLKNSTANNGEKPEVRRVAVRKVVIKTAIAHFIIRLNRDILVLPEKYVQPQVYYSKEVSPYGMSKIITEGLISRTDDVLITHPGRTEGYKNVRRKVFCGVDWMGRRIQVVTNHKFIDCKLPIVSYTIKKNADIVYKVSGYHRKVEVVNGIKKKDRIRVLNRRIASEDTDDIVFEEQQEVTEIERGIYSLITHGKLEKECSPIEQVIRYYFYKNSGLTKLLKPFKPIDGANLLESLPIYTGLSPILVIHMRNTVLAVKIPLDKSLEKQYSLLGKWEAISSLRSQCLFESKALLLDHLVTALSTGSPVGRSVKRCGKVSNTRYWHVNEAVVRASKLKDKSCIIFIQNHSAHSSIVGIIGMKITNVRPLETVLYRSRMSMDGMSININRL